MSSIELPLGWPTVLRAVIDGPGLWASPLEIVARKGLQRLYRKRFVAVKIVMAQCRKMLAAGWLEGSVDGPSPAVTLSVAASDRLGVHCGDGDRWMGFDLRRQPKVRYYSFSRDQLSVWFEIPDPQPGPDEAAIASEEHEMGQGSSEVSEPPAPVQNSPGMGPHWIWHWRRSTCEHCRHVRLPEPLYCLGCGRPWWEQAA